LRLSVTERAFYSYLLRHSHLEGRRRLRFSISWLARGVRLPTGPARDALRRLLIRGVLRLMQRSRARHLIEVRLPGEIRAARGPAPPPRAVAHEVADFLESKALRQAIHARAAVAFIVCGAPRPSFAASTTSCRSPAAAALPTKTSSLAAWNATPRKGNAPPRISSAGSTASAA
jgi:hypothetical protein